MKVKVTNVFSELDGKPVKRERGSEIDFTLRTACVNVLIMIQDDKKIQGEEKYKQAELARVIFNEDEPDLKSEDVVILKKRIGDVYSPLIVKQAWDWLEGENDKPASDKKS